MANPPKLVSQLSTVSLSHSKLLREQSLSGGVDEQKKAHRHRGAAKDARVQFNPVEFVHSFITEAFGPFAFYLAFKWIGKQGMIRRGYIPGMPFFVPHNLQVGVKGWYTSCEQWIFVFVLNVLWFVFEPDAWLPHMLLILLDLQFILRCSIIAAKYALLSPSFLARMRNGEIDAEELASSLVGVGWWNPNDTVIASSIPLAAHRADVDLASLRVHILRQGGVVEEVKGEDVVRGVMARECQMEDGFRKSFGWLQYVVPWAHVVFFFIVRGAQGLLPSYKDPLVVVGVIVQILYCILSLFYLWTLTLYLMSGWIDARRRLHFVREMGQMALEGVNVRALEYAQCASKKEAEEAEELEMVNVNEKDGSSTSSVVDEWGADEKCERHFVDMSYPVNIGAWVALRRVFDAIGLVFKARIETYIGLYLIIITAGLIWLAVAAFTEGSDLLKENLVFLITMAWDAFSALGIALLIVIRTTDRLQAMKEHVHILTQELVTCRLQLGHPDGLEEHEKERLRRADPLLYAASRSLDVSDKLRPPRVLGFAVSDGMMRAMASGLLAGVAAMIRIMNTS